MKNYTILLLSALLLFSVSAFSQSMSAYDLSDTSLYYIGRKSNARIYQINDTIYFKINSNKIQLKRLSSIFPSDGTPIDIVHVNSSGDLRKSPVSSLPFLNISDTIGKWKPIGYVPDYSEITNKPSFATVATSGSYLDLSNRPTLSTVAMTGNYNDLSNKPTIPSNIPIVYTNSANTTTGNATFYLTSDKTSSGAALFSSAPAIVPTINDSDNNYSYEWSLSGDFKTLTVNCKVSSGINVALLGLTLLGAPANVANGITVNVLVTK